MRRLLQPLPKRLVVIDTLRELQQRGVVEAVTIDEMRHRMLTTDCYHLGVYPEGDEQFAYICEAVASRNDITLAIDEMDAWFPTSTHLPPQALLNIALTGGHYDQVLICITHRPSAIHHSIMSQGTLWIFPMYDANDCKSVMAHTRRPGNPSGLDPQTIQPIEMDHRGWTQVTELAKVTPTNIEMLEFDLRDSKLYAYVEQPEVNHDQLEQDDSEEDPPEEAETVSHQDVDFWA